MRGYNDDGSACRVGHFGIGQWPKSEQNLRCKAACQREKWREEQRNNECHEGEPNNSSDPERLAEQTQEVPKRDFCNLRQTNGKFSVAKVLK